MTGPSQRMWPQVLGMAEAGSTMLSPHGEPRAHVVLRSAEFRRRREESWREGSTNLVSPGRKRRGIHLGFR